MPKFEEFPKIGRLSRDMVITEKLDGTNAQVYVEYEVIEDDDNKDVPWIAHVGGFKIAAGSRTQYITPERDNYGFAKWVVANAEELVKLGTGKHYGEWWGQGIQRRYGLNEKRFSLFNVGRWGQERPLCCHIVPTLYEGLFNTEVIEKVLFDLKISGSQAAPGFMQPEGIVIFHKGNRALFKKTFEKDAAGKGQ